MNAKINFPAKVIWLLFTLNTTYCTCTSLMDADEPITTRPMTLMERLERDKIIPDLLDSAPAETVRVNFSSGVTINPGDEVSSYHINEMPYIMWNGTENLFYAIMFVDIDSPSRMDPINRSYLIWLIVNIPGDSQNGGEMLAQYRVLWPERNTGLHRLVILIYQQPGNVSFNEDAKALSSRRFEFSPKKFAEEYKFGPPIAANYFLIEYEDDLPENILRMLNNYKTNSASNNGVLNILSLSLAGYGIFDYFKWELKCQN